MKKFHVNQVGKVKVEGHEMRLEILPEYKKALKELEGFSHLNVIWWCSELDDEESRKTIEAPSPYKGSPEVMGIFATRSPLRPNPIAVSTVEIINIDYEKATIHIAYIDAHDETPILDLKPYTPSIDRVENPKVPKWCSHWPKNLEESGDFDWESQFNF